MSSDIQRPQPDPDDPLYQAHFQGLRENTLRVQQCEQCGHQQWPPRELCGACRADRFQWPSLAGEGRVYTWSVVYRAPHPWFKAHLPYAIVVVELEGGLRMLGNSFGADVEHIACDRQVSARFQQDPDSGVTFLQWVPKPDASSS